MVNSFYSPSRPPYSVADGSVEIQGIPVIWDTATVIRKEVVAGEDYYEPSTGEISSLPGKPKYPNITVSGIFNREVGNFLLTFFDKDIARDGSLTATYMWGKGSTQLKYTLLKVRLFNLEFPGSDKLGSAAAKTSLEFSYNGIKQVGVA